MKNTRVELLLLHALPFGGSMWASQLALLPGATYAPTLYGLGDEREYLISQYTSTGGVQRFKAGHHGAAHSRAAMIGYIQDGDVYHWVRQIDAWIDAIVAEPTVGWSAEDKLALIQSYDPERVAALQSNHVRRSGLQPIRIDHLWIEM